jgi:hypothetical protein
LTIDHEDPACHSRVEFTRWPWMDRVPAGTAEVLDFALGFPMGWKNGPEPVSVFQMYCRSANVSVPLVVLELAKEGQIKDAQGRPAKAGQLQVVHKRSDGKYYRALTPFMAQEGTFMPIRMKAVHGQKEGQLSFSVAGQGVYDVVDWMVDPADVLANAQWKIGLYMHALAPEKADREAVRKRMVAMGIKKTIMDVGPLTSIRLAPGEGMPPGWQTTVYSGADLLASAVLTERALQNAIADREKIITDCTATIQEKNAALQAKDEQIAGLLKDANENRAKLSAIKAITG